MINIHDFLIKKINHKNLIKSRREKLKFISQLKTEIKDKQVLTANPNQENRTYQNKTINQSRSFQGNKYTD